MLVTCAQKTEHAAVEEKIEVDGTVGRSSGDGGGGVVFRDHQGAFRGALAHLFPHVVNPVVAELMACRKALQVGRELHFQRLHVEMESIEAVCMINDVRRNLSMAGAIVRGGHQVSNE